MEKKEKISTIVIIILCLFSLTSLIYWVGPGQGTSGADVVPLFNVSMFVHLLTLLMWALIGSLIFIIIFPFLLVPGFLLIKRIIWRKYTDSYIEYEVKDIDMKKFIKRAIYVLLLTLGISASVLEMFNLDLLISIDKKTHWTVDIGIALEYTPYIFIGLALIVYPIVIGLWSIGWALEDTGLMHYKLPQEEETILFEIEPIHLKYTSIIKGYAGIASIFYLVRAFLHYSERGINFFGGGYTEIYINTFALTFLFIPAYLFYFKVLIPRLTKFFRKGKEPIPMISERQLEDFKKNQK